MPSYVTTKSGRRIERPSAEEEVHIQTGMAADPDTRELSDAEMAQLKPIAQRGRPPSPQPKIHTGIRLDADVLAAFKSGGRGWQTRIKDVLKDWLKSHPDNLTG